MKWRRWVLVCALIVVAVVIVSLINYRSEPRYNGKSLSAWLRIWQRSKGGGDKYEAEQAVRHIGTNAIPFLLEDLRNGIPAWLFEISPRWLARRDPRARAIDGFTILGPDAVPAIPELIHQMEGSRTPVGPIIVMARIGRPAVRPLIEAMTNHANSVIMRASAAEVLNMIGTDGSESVWALLACLKDEPQVSVNALWALSSVAADPGMVVPALTNALASPQVSLRAAAVGSLGRLAKRAPAVVPIPLLRAALMDENRSVRLRATNALSKLKPQEFPGLR